MTKKIDKVVPDQPSAKNKNDENCENKKSVTIPSKVSGDIETALDTPKNALITTQERDNINQVVFSFTFVMLHIQFVADHKRNSVLIAYPTYENEKLNL